MNNLINSSKRIFYEQKLIALSKNSFSQKIYKYITPKNTQEYHDKEVFEHFKDNVHYK